MRINEANVLVGKQLPVYDRDEIDIVYGESDTSRVNDLITISVEISPIFA